MALRVSDALSKLLSPLTSTRTGTDENRNKKDEHPTQGSVKSPIPETTPTPQAVSPPAPSNPAILNPFLQITALIQTHGKTVSRWIGLTSYRFGAQKQKKSTKFRKGTIIDNRVE